MNTEQDKCTFNITTTVSHFELVQYVVLVCGAVQSRVEVCRAEGVVDLCVCM